MSDQHPPLSGKEQAFQAASSDVVALERALADFRNAVQAGQTDQVGGLGAVARLEKYSSLVQQALAVLGDDERAEEFRARFGRVWQELDDLLKKAGASFQTLLAASQGLFQGGEIPEPNLDETTKLEVIDKETPKEEWQENRELLASQVQELFLQVRTIIADVQANLPTLGGITAQNLTDITEYLARYDQLEAAYELAAERYPDQAVVFQGDWRRTATMFKAFRPTLERMQNLQVRDLGEKTKAEKAPEETEWPPEFMTSARDYLGQKQPEYTGIKALIDATPILKPSEPADVTLRDQATTFVTDFQHQKAGLNDQVKTLGRWEKIVQADMSVSAATRLARQGEVTTLQTDLEGFIKLMEAFEELVWEKTILFVSVEAKTLQDYVDAYTDPVPGSVDMAGYQVLRTGVTDLLSRLAAVRGVEARICGGRANRQTILRAWLDGFNGELNRRRLVAFVFWRDHLPQMHQSFDETKPATMAKLLAESKARADYSGLPKQQIEAKRTGLAAALAVSESEISSAVAARQLPPETEEDAYSKHAGGKWAEVRLEIDRIKAAEDQKEAFDFMQDIRDQLKAKENTVFAVTFDDNQITEFIKDIRAIFAEKVKLNPLIPDLEKRKLEIEIAQAEYKLTRIAYIDRMEEVESKNINPGESIQWYGKVISPRTVMRMEQIVSELELLSKPPASRAMTEAAKYKDDYERIKKDFGRRKAAHLAWAKVWPHVIGQSEGSRGREPVNGLNDDNFPLFGDVVHGLIQEGMISREFGGGTNGALGNIDVDTEDFDTVGGTQRERVRQTLFGFCMRRFDLAYQQKIPELKGVVATNTIHMTFDKLVEHVYGEAVAEYRRTGGRGTPPFNKHDVSQAWRLHSISTLNLSYLAEGSPTMPDNYYYMFNWVDYCVKYALAQTNSFDAMQTLLVFGYRGANPLEILYTPAELEQVEERLREKGWLGGNSDKAQEEMAHLWAMEGYTSFAPLLRAPLIGVKNVAKRGQPVKAPVFEPPLRTFAVEEELPDGRRVPKRKATGDGSDGEIVRFDDLQTMSGQRLYEQMPFDQLGLVYPEYYNQIANNAMWLLTNVFKAKTEDFLKSMDSSAWVKTLRNQVKYAMPWFSVVGADIRTKRKRTRGGVEQGFDETIMNQVTNQLILAKLLMETDYLKPDFWSIHKVEDYLQRLVSDQAIAPEVAEALKLTVIEGRKWSIRSMTFLKQLQSQVESAAKMK